MTSTALSSALMTLVIGVLIGAGILLARKRDALQSLFGAAKGPYKAVVDLAPGVRLAVVELDGMTIVCGIGKSGITALQVVDHAKPQVVA